MAHPFEKMFEKALNKSSEGENLVTQEAQRLLGKGYSFTEIHSVLSHLAQSLINEHDELLIRETITELEEAQ